MKQEVVQTLMRSPGKHGKNIEIQLILRVNEIRYWELADGYKLRNGLSEWW